MMLLELTYGSFVTVVAAVSSIFDESHAYPDDIPKVYYNVIIIIFYKTECKIHCDVKMVGIALFR